MRGLRSLVRTGLRLGVIAALVAVGLVGVGAGSAGASVSFATTPYPLPFQPTSVACPTTQRCLILGQSAIVGVDNGFVGNEITYDPQSSLADASCPAENSCIAVGITSDPSNSDLPSATVTPLTLGGPGTMQPDLFGDGLSAVACGSPTDCVAIGYVALGIGAIVVHIVNGAIASSTTLHDGDPSFGLSDVACSTASQCVAVGEYQDKAAILPIIDGQPQTVALLDGVSLLGISCPQANQCYAVGSSGNQGIVVPVSYGGVGRVIAIPPGNGSGSLLNAIACPTSFTCVAVGADYDQDTQQLTSIAVPVLGGKVNPPQPGPALDLTALACSDSSTCTAVGGDLSGNYDAVQLAVSPTATTTTLTQSPGVTTFGANLTLTATVQPVVNVGSPTGTVTFTDGSITLGSATLSAGQASVSTATLSAGSHTVTASYSGDLNFAPSSTTLTVTVGKAASALAASPATKKAASFSATLTRSGSGAPLAGEQVVFQTKSGSKNNVMDTVCSAVTDASGSASCTGKIPSADKFRDKTYTAAFGGDANYAATSATAPLS